MLFFYLAFYLFVLIEINGKQLEVFFGILEQNSMCPGKVDEEDWEESVLTSKVGTSVTALFHAVSQLTCENKRNVHASHKPSHGHSPDHTCLPGWVPNKLMASVSKEFWRSVLPGPSLGQLWLASITCLEKLGKSTKNKALVPPSSSPQSRHR